MIWFVSFAAAATLTVGPTGTWPTPCAAIAAASAGDVIEVDAAGTYDGDTCSWSTDALTIRGVNGRARIDDTGVSLAEQKGIFVIHAPTATIESFELVGASVRDQNGAGIRHQGTDLVVRDCLFHDNQDGILGSPEVDGTGEVTIESSEFHDNGAGDGQSHNVYLNHYWLVTLRASYSHHANVGHLFKSRALVTHILWSRLTDEADGRASYEVDIPNAGKTWIVGSVIEQTGTTENSSMIAYGEESDGMNATSDLHLVNVTMLNDAGRGTFVNVASAVPTPADIMNTLFVGAGTITSQATASIVGSWDDSMGDPLLADVAAYDLRPVAGSPLVDAGVDPGAYAPTAEYVHPLSEWPRDLVNGAYDIGAYEYGNTGAGPDTGSGDSGGGDSGDGDSGVGDSGDGASAGPVDKGGCGCRTSGAPSTGLVLALAALALRRRPS